MKVPLSPPDKTWHWRLRLAVEIDAGSGDRGWQWRSRLAVEIEAGSGEAGGGKAGS